MKFTDQVDSLSQRIEELMSTCREISAEERTRLESQGNVIAGRILVRGEIAFDTIRSNVFLGTVVLEKFEKSASIGALSSSGNCPNLTSCVSGCTLSDVVIDGPCFLKDCAMMHGVYIASGCVLIGNGVISGNFSKHQYGIGSEIVLCEETGTRSILSHPDHSSLEEITRAIESKESRMKFNQLVESLSLGGSRFMGCVFQQGSVAMKCGTMESCWIHEKVHLANSEIRHSIIGTNSKVDSSVVEKSIVGKRVSVEGFSVVEKSILNDFSKVSIHGKVVHSLIGSYSGVESGECISSLIGPFVGFHHQALCIATYWPGGRGNIGYGANVGSNHSGKAPDCELISGEGVFFGLATVIKFPCNFSKAPYSLIASGVTCLPQRMEMPFSLINTGNMTAQYPGLNEISPGWILSDNMFTLLRNEEKFLKRQNSEATVVYDHQVFRPDIMRLVVEARRRLESVRPVKDGVYTESDIEGLGKNYLREDTRLRAIDTYSFILRWYGLRGVYRRINSVGLEKTQHEIQQVASECKDMQHCLETLLMEKMNLKELKSLMEEFAKLDFLISSSCVSSKTKDDVRGSKIIGSVHKEFHPPASEHSVCVKAKKNSAEIESNVAKIVSRL
jgi:hypothetical protein